MVGMQVPRCLNSIEAKQLKYVHFSIQMYSAPNRKELKYSYLVLGTRSALMSHHRLHARERTPVLGLSTGGLKDGISVKGILVQRRADSGEGKPFSNMRQIKREQRRVQGILQHLMEK